MRESVDPSVLLDARDASERSEHLPGVHILDEPPELTRFLHELSHHLSSHILETVNDPWRFHVVNDVARVLRLG